MTDKQLGAVHALLCDKVGQTLHHGDCVGADVQADEIARYYAMTIVVHPPSSKVLRAFKQSSNGLTLAQKPYRERNQDIVNACSILIACPDGPNIPGNRSGTWMTIRLARTALDEDKLDQIFVIHREGGSMHYTSSAYNSRIAGVDDEPHE
jgi:hypothetical protein